MGHQHRITPYTVSIIGASGYSGSELTKFLLGHPYAEIAHLYAHGQAGKAAQEVYPHLDTDIIYETYEGDLSSDIYFLALPHGEALKLVPELVAAGKYVVDLSGDFRLKSTAVHEQYYGSKKPEGATLQYGLPELFKDEILKSKAISNPGCYATSIMLGLAPFLAQDAYKSKVQSVAVSSISGISGAGRSAKMELSFSEMSGNARAYKVGTHQHMPEILQAFGIDITTKPFPFSFVPMIAPLVRGIYTTLTIKLSEGMSKASVETLFKEFYRDAPFTRVRNVIPEIKDVAYTNFCDIGIGHADTDGTLIIVTAIDNLIKGAAGQAIQNMNLMLGFDERLSLSPVATRQVQVTQQL